MKRIKIEAAFVLSDFEADHFFPETPLDGVEAMSALEEFLANKGWGIIEDAKIEAAQSPAWQPAV